MLVDGGGDLCGKYGVLIVQEGVVARRVVAVHGVPRLVGEGEHAAEVMRLVIKQYVGVAAVRGCCERARPFAPVFVSVNPAVQESLLEHVAIWVAERMEGIDDGGDGALVGVMRLYCGDDGNMEII